MIYTLFIENRDRPFVVEADEIRTFDKWGDRQYFYKDAAPVAWVEASDVQFCWMDDAVVPEHTKRNPYKRRGD